MLPLEITLRPLPAGQSIYFSGAVLSTSADDGHPSLSVVARSYITDQPSVLLALDSSYRATLSSVQLKNIAVQNILWGNMFG